MKILAINNTSTDSTIDITNSTNSSSPAPTNITDMPTNTTSSLPSATRSTNTPTSTSSSMISNHPASLVPSNTGIELSPTIYFSGATEQELEDNVSTDVYDNWIRNDMTTDQLKISC